MRTPAAATPTTVPDSARALITRGLSAGAIMLGATMVSNVANYAYSLIMGRQLGPALFGGFTALLGVLMILSVASQSVQTVVARYTTGLRRAHGLPAVSAFARRLLGRLTVVGVIAFALWVPLSFPLAAALEIDALPVIAAGSVLILGFAMPVVWGVLQGDQRFGGLGINISVLAVGRLVVGVALVAAGASLTGAIGAITIATFVAFALAYPGVARPGRGTEAVGQRVGPSARELVTYGLPALTGLAAWTLLTNIDVVFVKAMASSVDAGYYGAAVTIGKIALFMPLAFGIVIFPKAVARNVAGIDARPLMRRAGQLLLVMSALFVVGCLVAGKPLLELMFGESFLPANELLVPVVAAMCCFALTNVMLFFYLSVHRMSFAAALFGVVVVQAVALALVAGDPLMAAYVQLAIGLVVVVANELFFVPLIRPLT